MARMTPRDFTALKGKNVVFLCVTYNEDVRVRLVRYGEDASFRKDLWEVGDKAIRVKYVTYGEDVKLKQVDKGGDFVVGQF